MPATKAKSKVTRTPRTRKKCQACRDHAIKALAWACAMEKLEAGLEQESSRCVSLAGENERLEAQRDDTRALVGRLETELDVMEAERDAMLDVMEKALDMANRYYVYERKVGCHLQAKVDEQRKEICKLLTDLQLVQSGCTRELGGSVWVRGEQIAECLNRYTNGRCAQ